MGKQNLYEESVRVPMVLQGSGITAGTCDSLVNQFDLYPSLCDLLGLSMSASVQGKALRRCFKRPNSRTEILCIVFTETAFGRCAMVVTK